MQKDMKIGMLAGLVLVAGAMLYVCTRSDLSTKSRILNREKNNEQHVQHQQQAQIKKMVTFGPAVAKAKDVEPKMNVSQQSEQTRYVQTIPSFDKTQQDTKVIVEPKPVVVEKPKPVIETPPVRTYKPKKFYIVRRGDSLSKISKMYYGSANDWHIIYDANRHILANPNRIKVGMKLHIPD